MRRHPTPIALAGALIVALMAAREAEALRAIGPDAPKATAEGLYGGDDDFFVGRIVAVSDTAPTWNHPRHVTVEVAEVLRGDPPRGRILVEWTSPPYVGLSPYYVHHEAPPIAAWERRLIDALPVPGRTMLLGGAMGPRGLWQSDAFLRWEDADTSAVTARHMIAQWDEPVRERHAREAAARRVARAKVVADSLAAEAAHVRADQAWLDSAATVAAHADLPSLVRESDVVVVVSPPTFAPVAAGWYDLARLTTHEWLLAPPDGAPDSAVNLAVAMSPRELPARALWQAPIADDRPGSARGDSVRCLAFLRRPLPVGSGPYGGPAAGAAKTLWRLADPAAGLLFADSATVRAVRAALARRPADAIAPPVGCGASLAEFADLDTAGVRGVLVRITRLGAGDPERFPPTFLLGCASSAAMPAAIGLDAGWCPACALPDERGERAYRDPIVGGALPPTDLLAFLDSLRSLPPLRVGRIDPDDSLTIALRRSVNGRERLFEATLDDSARAVLWRMCAARFRFPGMPRFQMAAFWNAYGSRWSRPFLTEITRQPVPASSAGESKPLPVGTCAILGLIVDAESGESLPVGYVQSPDLHRTAYASSDGDYALTGLVPGQRWLQVSASNHRTFDTWRWLRPDTITPIVFTLGGDSTYQAPPMLRGASRLGPATIVHSSLSVRVRDRDGRAVPRAWVRVEDGDRAAGGFTSARGVVRVAWVHPGRHAVAVRAVGHAPWLAALMIEGGSHESLGVTLDR